MGFRSIRRRRSESCVYRQVPHLGNIPTVVAEGLNFTPYFFPTVAADHVLSRFEKYRLYGLVFLQGQYIGSTSRTASESWSSTPALVVVH